MKTEKRVFLVLLAVCLLLSTVAVSVSASESGGAGRTYTVLKADGSLSVDAEMGNNEYWENVPWTEDFYKVAVTPKDGAPQENFSARMKVMWFRDDDGAYLYFWLEIVDATPSETADWTQDGLIFGISENGAGFGPVGDPEASYRRTGTQSLTSAGKGYPWFQYAVKRADGKIYAEVRYTYHAAEYAFVNAECKLDFMIQNNLGAGAYERVYWNSLPGKTINDSGEACGPCNGGVCTLSDVPASRANITLTDGDRTVAKLAADQDGKVVLPGYERFTESIEYGAMNKVTGVTRSRAPELFQGWKDEQGTLYQAGDIYQLPEGAVQAALTAVCELPREDSDVLLKLGEDLIGVMNRDQNGNVTLPEYQSKDGQMIGWLDESEGKLYPVGSSFAVTGNEQIVLKAVLCSVRLVNGAAIYTDSPASIRFEGYTDGNEMAGLGTFLAGKGILLIPASELTETVLADSVLSGKELQEAGISFEKLPASTDGMTGDHFCAVKDHVTDVETVYAASAFITIRYSDGSEQSFYSVYSPENHSRSIREVARRAYADRSSIRVEQDGKTYENKVGKEYACGDFTSVSYSPFSAGVLDVLKQLAGIA